MPASRKWEGPFGDNRVRSCILAVASGARYRSAWQENRRARWIGARKLVPRQSKTSSDWHAKAESESLSSSVD